MLDKNYFTLEKTHVYVIIPGFSLPDEGICMTLVKENLQKNPLYDQGMFFDQNFYKSKISDEKLGQEMDTSRVGTFYNVAVVVEVAKKVALVALVIIPTLAILGPYMFATVFLTGAAAGVMEESITSDQSILKRIGLQAELNACMDSCKAYIQPAIDFFSTAGVTSGAYLAMTFTTGIFANVFIYGGAFMAGNVLAKEAVAFGFEQVEKQAAQRHSAMLAAKA